MDWKIVYLIETIVLTGLLVTYFINLKKGNKKNWLLYCVIAIVSIFIVEIFIEKPKMYISNDALIEVEAGQEIKAPKTVYHCRDITKKVEVIGNFDNKVGEYNVGFKVKTLTGAYIKEAKIKVVDTTPPEIILEGGEKYNVEYGKKYVEPGYKAIDVTDGNITSKVAISRGKINDSTYTVTYEVEDSYGNKRTVVREITVVDTVAPTIQLNGSANMAIPLNHEYKELGARAVDIKDGDLTGQITIEGTVDSTKVGDYELTYKVSDLSGNEATKTRKVSVNEKGVKRAEQGKDGEPGTIYLTFDDGPSTNITPKILNVLKEKNVKATFFILNYNSEGEKLVKREVEEGHTVAIHGYSHEYKKIYKSVDGYMKNITKLQEKIKKSTGYDATIIRFPGGSSNTISRYNPGIMTKLTKEVVEKGYRYFDWNVSSGDAGDVKTADAVYKNVTKGLSKKRINVVLMHDFSGNKKTLKALPKIIDYAIENGYKFSNITTNTPMVTHKVNN